MTRRGRSLLALEIVVTTCVATVLVATVERGSTDSASQAAPDWRWRWRWRGLVALEIGL